VRSYDHMLCRALSRLDLDVELVTTPIARTAAPAPDGYGLTEPFTRRSGRLGPQYARVQRPLRAAEHLVDMGRHRLRPTPADVRHYQWLPLEPADGLLLARGAPRVFTMHNVLRRASRTAALASARRLARRVDAVVVHTHEGARTLTELGGVPAERVHVIPHGPLDHLAELPCETSLPEELARVQGPVILCFGMIRPYKGVDVLLEAFREIGGAELWIVGLPLRTPMAPLHEQARQASGRVRFVTRYVSDAELAAYFRRADLVVLPYREIDQSGVLSCGLAFGKAMVASAVGGFTEVAEEHGAARLVPPGDPRALAAALSELLADPGARHRLEAAATAAARGPYSWAAIADQTADLYRQLIAKER